MNREEIIALKLQLGLSPSARVAPGFLLAMWQQLKTESMQAKYNRSDAVSGPGPMTRTPIDDPSSA